MAPVQRGASRRACAVRASLAGLFVCAAVGAGAWGATACGAANNEAFGGGGDDGGSGDAHEEYPGFDGSGDAGPEAGTPGPTAATFVLAAPGWTSVRVCWDMGLDPFPLRGTPMPGANYPGIPQGGAALLADASDLTKGSSFTLWVLDAQAVDTSERLALSEHAQQLPFCGELACDGPGSKCVGKGKWAAISGQTPLVAGSPYLLAIVQDGANLALQAMTLARTDSIPPNQLVVQAAQVAPSLQSIGVSFGLPADAGALVTLGNLGDVAPQQPSALAYDTTESAFGAQGFTVQWTGSDGGAAQLSMSLAQSLALVAPTQDPSAYYAQRTAFVAAVVGDPAAPSPGSDAGAYDGTGLHVLVLPTTSAGGASSGGSK